MTVWVTGYLGAGKSTLVSSLQDQGVDTREADPLKTPPAGAQTIAVADAANCVTTLADPVAGPLVRAQLASAGLVVISRGDVTAAGPTREAIRPMVSCPVVEASMGALDPALFEELGFPSDQAELDLRKHYTTWSYDGPGNLSDKALDRFLARRPKGIYRMVGVLRVDKAALEIEIAGQVRQTRPIGPIEATRLTAIGPSDRFREAEMALHFAEAMSESTGRRGLFSHR